MLVERLDDDLVTVKTYDEAENKIIKATTYDNSEVLRLNAAERAERGMQKYKGNMVHAGRIHLGDIERLMNLGYDLLSPDPDEVRRALVYIQSNEPHLLTVEGKPFARKRKTWQ